MKIHIYVDTYIEGFQVDMHAGRKTDVERRVTPGDLGEVPPGGGGKEPVQVP